MTGRIVAGVAVVAALVLGGLAAYWQGYSGGVWPTGEPVAGTPAAEPAAAPALSPPVAPEEPRELAAHGILRIDPYYWMRNREDPRVRTHLEAENAYALQELAPITPLIDQLYAEMVARLDDAEISVPYLDNGYWYETRYAEGANYPVIVRRAGTPDGPEEVVLDVPALAEGHELFNLNSWVVSPNGRLVAYAVDFKGDRRHDIFVRDIATGATIEQRLTGADADIVWASDNATLFYVRSDPVTVRSYQVWRHRIGTDPASDVLVTQEDDSTFSLGIGQTKSRRFLVVTHWHHQTREQAVVPLDAPETTPRVIARREPGVRYAIDHVGARFYILTNRDAPDQRVVSAPEATPEPGNWVDVVSEQPGSFLSDMVVFDDHIALDIERDAAKFLRVVRLSDGADLSVPRTQAIGVMSTGDFDDAENRDPAATGLRYGFEAPDHPPEIREIDFATGEVRVLKRDPAWSWFDPARYELLRISAQAPDGVEVPVTILRPAGASGPLPTLVLGYGAYGNSMTPSFIFTGLSLVDRGFAFALAHVRGGRDRGEAWYAAGRMAQKMNSFTDFIAVGEALVARGLARPDQLYARGGSAGGLLMGGVINMRPDLFKAVIAEVPFVDVLTTMSDPTIPLTTFEYEEWGNPEILEQYRWMAAYSPYDNVQAQAYPSLFVLAGFNDSQVGYFEPAKWVARIRARRTNAAPLLFMTEMEAGHAGASGRLGFLVERARVYGWLLAQAGVTQ